MNLPTFSSYLNRIRPGHPQARDVSYGSHPKMSLDIYGKKTDKLKPVIMFWHGGSWSKGDKNYYQFIADYLEHLGAIVVIVGHPLYPDQTFPGFIDDANKAIDWTRAHIGEYGGDSACIFTMGHSSGAHIASITTMSDLAHRVQGCIAIAAPSTISKTYYAGVFGSSFKNNMHQPASYASKSQHRFLLIHGVTDHIVSYRDSVRLHKALLAAGNQSELVTLRVMGHMRILITLIRPFAYRYRVGRKIKDFVHQH